MKTQATDSKPQDQAVDAAQFPETAKFMDWYRQEQAKGLQDIKFFTGNLSVATAESFFAEVNLALAADTVPDHRAI